MTARRTVLVKPSITKHSIWSIAVHTKGFFLWFIVMNNEGKKFRRVFIPFTNFLSSQDRSGFDGWICVHKDFAFCLEDQVSDFLTHDETGLGAIDHQAVGNSVENSNKKWKNCWFTDNEKFRIAKYAADEGPIAAVKKFKKFHQNLKFDESTTRSLGQRYHDMQIIWLLYRNAKKKTKTSWASAHGWH